MASARLTGQKIRGQKQIQLCRIERGKDGTVVRTICTPAKKRNGTLR